jgi:hypothetical protein
MHEIEQQEGKECKEDERLNEDIVLDSNAYSYIVPQYEDEMYLLAVFPVKFYINTGSTHKS